MNLSLHRRSLTDALSLLSGLAGKKPPWSYVHLAATKGDLADELELAVAGELDTLTVSIEAEVQREGRLVVPLSALQALATAETGPSLSLKEDRGHIKALGASVRGSVAIGDLEGYPALFRPPEEGWIDLQRAPLWGAVDRAMSLAGVEHGASTNGLDGCLVREVGGMLEILSWHGWRATLESLETTSGVDFQAVISHGNWSNLRHFDFPTVGLMVTGTHTLWRQPGMLLACRRNEAQDKRWPATDNQGLTLLRQPADGGLTLTEGEASQILAAKKALEQAGGVPMVVAWDRRRLSLTRENDVNSASIRLELTSDVQPWEFKTKDLDGIFECLALVAKDKLATLTPWPHGLRVTIDKLTASLAPFGG